MKVTWDNSERIHRTTDNGMRTVCGHCVAHRVLYKNTKRNNCKTCFKKKEHYRESWLICPTGDRGPNDNKFIPVGS